MLSKKLIISTAIALPILGVIFMANAPIASADVCTANLYNDLQGTVSRNVATVTNYSKNNCTYQATLAVYDSPQEPETYGWIDAQTLIGSTTVDVEPGQTVTIKVDGDKASCWNQSDLLRGGQNQVLPKPYYWNAMDVDVYSDDSCKVKVTPTPEATATPTPQPGVSSFAPTGNTIMTYMLILAGAASLITGIVLRRFSK